MPVWRYIAHWFELFQLLLLFVTHIKIIASWNTSQTAHNLADRYGRFVGTCCLYLRGRRRKSYVAPRSWYWSSKLGVFKNRNSVILTPQRQLQTYSNKNTFRMNIVFVKIRVSCNLSLPLFNVTIIVQSSVRILHKTGIILNRQEMFLLGTLGKWRMCFWVFKILQKLLSILFLVVTIVSFSLRNL
jgi:hypothetical protein